jgi:hypothetical protein
MQRLVKDKFVLAVLATLSCLLSLLVLVACGANSSGEKNGVYAAPVTPVPTEKETRKPLPSNQADWKATADAVPDKAFLDATVASLKATAIANREAANEPPPDLTKIAQNLPTAAPTPTPFTGLTQAQNLPFFRQEFLAENVWYGYVKGELVGVYAGRLLDKSERGAVYIITSGGPSPAQIKKIQKSNLSESTGTLKIVTVDESKLKFTLETKKGEKVVYDFNSQAFEGRATVTSTVIPTTPQPTVVSR